MYLIYRALRAGEGRDVTDGGGGRAGAGCCTYRVGCPGGLVLVAQLLPPRRREDTNPGM